MNWVWILLNRISSISSRVTTHLQSRGWALFEPQTPIFAADRHQADPVQSVCRLPRWPGGEEGTCPWTLPAGYTRYPTSTMGRRRLVPQARCPEAPSWLLGVSTGGRRTTAAPPVADAGNTYQQVIGCLKSNTRRYRCRRSDRSVDTAVAERWNTTPGKMIDITSGEWEFYIRLYLPDHYCCRQTAWDPYFSRYFINAWTKINEILQWTFEDLPQLSLTKYFVVTQIFQALPVDP